MPSVRSQVVLVALALVSLCCLEGCITTSDSASTATLAPLGPPDKVAPTTTITATTAEVTTTTAVASLGPVAPTAAPTTETIVDSTTSTVAATAGASYTVVAGDTLYRIGRQAGVTAKAIADFNGWADGVSHAIFPGNVIKIPAAGTTPPPASTGVPTATTVKAASTTTTAPPSSKSTYTVQPGDYLVAIARKTGTTVAGIVAANGWSDGTNHKLVPGDVIKLPPKS